METFNSDNAPKAVGPYSHGARTGNLLYLSGQIPLDPASMQVVEGGIEAQTQQVLTNIQTVLASQGLEMSHVIKTTIFMTDLSDFAVVNGIYADAFGDHKPARSTVQVAGLPLGVQVKIEVIAEVQ